MPRTIRFAIASAALAVGALAGAVYIQSGTHAPASGEAVAAPASSAPGSSPSLAPATGAVVQQIGVQAYPLNFSIETATAKADSVLVGTVRSVGSDRWTTPDGLRPKDLAPGGLPSDGHFIYRSAEVVIERGLAGVGSPATIRVTVRGGTVDGIHMFDAEGGDELKSGDRVVLFVVSPGHPGFLRATENWNSILTFQLNGDIARNEFQSPIPLNEVESRARAVKPAP